MKKSIVKTDKAPAAVGPYSQAVIADHLVFASGQIPLEPSTGRLVEGDIEEQVRQVLENLKQVLEAAGSSLDRVVKTTVFLTDMANFSKMNEVYATYFSSDPPARSTIQVAALPRDAAVEIEAIAFR